MRLVKPSSLAATLDAVNESLFFGRRLTKADRRAAARWIAGRQSLPGSYAGVTADLVASGGVDSRWPEWDNRAREQ